MLNKKIIKDKKGIEKIMSIWWIFSWILIVVGVLVITGFIYSKPIEVRDLQSDLISKRISSCFLDNFEEIYNNEEEFYKICNLNKDMKNNFAFRISIAPKEEDKKELYRNFGSNNQDFFAQCNIIGEEIKAKHYPYCSEQYFVLEFNNNLFEVKVKSASNEIGGRVRER